MRVVVLIGPFVGDREIIPTFANIMATRTDIPQIAVLRLMTEKRFGHPIESRADFTDGKVYALEYPYYIDLNKLLS